MEWPNKKERTYFNMGRKKVYPPPKDTPEFIRYWNLYLPLVTRRENFSIAHLEQLKILCELYVMYDYLQDQILENGITYESGGRNGYQIKPRPEVAQLKDTRNQIYQYSKMLGLTLVKDTNYEPDAGSAKKEEWA
jgi:phage terminase small subunit